MEPYITLQPSYEAAQLGVFGRMFLNGHIYSSVISCKCRQYGGGGVAVMGLIALMASAFQTMRGQDRAIWISKHTFMRPIHHHTHMCTGRKPVHWSPSSQTALAEAELEYPEGHK
eukprot:scaffold3705_cov21-Tisochrysis_lutea.AAC.1